ncbi:jg25849 [Pararge aegeria aegeria]|uniref:Jg25849 protein n=1 Tax=Pararge aegeria aegeria TaxID=348720 RepID=A0A8S4QQ08_9NEOP|nr:jg25849 [Pararge aegeria aegeria]
MKRNARDFFSLTQRSSNLKRAINCLADLAATVVAADSSQGIVGHTDGSRTMRRDTIQVSLDTKWNGSGH